jgi:hypothetical protein
MSMHLIVDGYNLIRQSPALRRCEAQDLEAGRQALLTLMAAYRRGRPRHQVTVVFDGWQAGGFQESRDQHLGVAVIYSRRGERADEVIKRLLRREGTRAVVVSSDRELQDWASRVGAAWVSAQEFTGDHLLAAQGEEDTEEPPARGPAKKGPARRLAKKERQRQQRLRKL